MFALMDHNVLNVKGRVSHLTQRNVINVYIVEIGAIFPQQFAFLHVCLQFVDFNFNLKRYI